MRPVRYPVAAIQNHKERTPNKVRMVSHEERHNKRMFTIIIRVAVILVTLILIMRLMGKKTLGEMQPFEFVITLVLSDLACSPMSDPAIPLSYGIVPIVVVFLLHFLYSLLSRKSFSFRKIMDGSPMVVISPEGVEYQTLKQLNMNVDDLIDATTAQGYFNLEDIYIAYFRTNGSLTIIPTAASAPPTLSDLAIKSEQTTYAMPFVEDGKLCNLDKMDADETTVRRALDTLGVRLKDIVVATADADGKVYVKSKEGPYLSRTVSALARSEVGV